MNDYLGGEKHGPDLGATLKPGTKPGLLFFDVTAGGRLAGKKRIRLRLNVAGLNGAGTRIIPMSASFAARTGSDEKNPDLPKIAP